MTLNLPQHPCANKCTEFKDKQCNTCLFEKMGSKQWYDIPMHHITETKRKFIKGDVVVYMNHIPISRLEIVEAYQPVNHYWLECGQLVHESQIRIATIAELLAKRRLSETEQSVAEVS